VTLTVGWSVEFYDFTSELPQVDVELLAGFGDVHERAARNGARHGTPVVISPAGFPDPRLNLFFRTGAMASAAVSTWRRYAYALQVWLDFLCVLYARRDWAEYLAARAEDEAEEREANGER
jgi:hypothetical protein